MIFVTVGTQLPFPRLLAMMEEVVDDPAQVFAQTADPTYSGALPSTPFLDRDEFAARCREASLIVGHTGTGTIFAARNLHKPLIVVPRRHHLGEHRSDHQFATARELERAGHAAVAEDVATLRRLVATPPPPLAPGDGPEKTRLIETLGALLK